MSATIIQMPTRASTPGLNGAGPTVRVETEGLRPRSTTPAELFELYPLGADQNPIVVTAMRLLADGNSRIDEALTYFRSDEKIGAADSIQRLRVLLPELFLCRSIGDGFGSVVLSTSSCLESAVEPLTEDQLIAVRRAIQRLQREPYLSF